MSGPGVDRREVQRVGKSCSRGMSNWRYPLEGPKFEGNERLPGPNRDDLSREGEIVPVQTTSSG